MITNLAGQIIDLSLTNIQLYKLKWDHRYLNYFLKIKFENLKNKKCVTLTTHQKSNQNFHLHQ